MPSPIHIVLIYMKHVSYLAAADPGSLTTDTEDRHKSEVPLNAPDSPSSRTSVLEPLPPAPNKLLKGP